MIFLKIILFIKKCTVIFIKKKIFFLWALSFCKLYKDTSLTDCRQKSFLQRDDLLTRSNFKYYIALTWAIMGLK